MTKALMGALGADAKSSLSLVIIWYSAPFSCVIVLGSQSEQFFKWFCPLYKFYASHPKIGICPWWNNAAPPPLKFKSAPDEKKNHGHATDVFYQKY